MASRKTAVASLPALLLIGALLLLVMACRPDAAVSEEEDAKASGQFPPASLDRAPEQPSPKNSRAVRAGSPVVSTSLDGFSVLPSSPATASPAAPPQAPAPAPQPHPCSEDGEKKLCLFIVIMIILLCGCNQR